MLRRDRGALIGLFLLPILFIGVFGNVLSSDPSEAEWPIGVHGAATSSAAARATRALEESPSFRVVPAPSAEAVRRQVASGELAVGLVFTPDFDPLGGRPAELVIDEAAARELRGALEGAIAGTIGPALLGVPPGMRLVEARTPPGLGEPLAGIGGFQIAVPGNAVLFGFFLSITVALSFVLERRLGTWRRLLSAPVRRSGLLVAKLVPYFIVGLFQMALFFGVGAWGFGMEVAGSVVALALITAAVCACSVALGLLLASVARTEKQVGGLGSLFVLTMALIGGCMYPRLAMPELMRDVGLAVPHAWALDGYYAVLVREGTGVLDVMPQIGALVGFSALFVLLAFARGTARHF